jgi:hypothetical protein
MWKRTDTDPVGPPKRLAQPNWKIAVNTAAVASVLPIAAACGCPG